MTRRGYQPNDYLEFGLKSRIKLNAAGEDLYFLLNRGYEIKSASTFIGNHYCLTQRQRIALTRIVSSKEKLQLRKAKELAAPIHQDHLVLDGFNTIISLEAALSHSLVIRGMDNTVRDLAGLRGTYHIIDQTKTAIECIFRSMDDLQIRVLTIYLDKPVSNSGRLKSLFYELSSNYKVEIHVEIINDVDSTLENLSGVVSSDAIILDKCISWYNLLDYIVSHYLKKIWLLELEIGKGLLH